MTERDHSVPETGHEHAHETSDVPARPLVLIAIGMAVAAVVIFAVIGLLYGYIYRQSIRSAAPVFVDSGVLPPEPRLQLAPVADLEQFRSREDRALRTYGWIDRESGVVRIPVDRAMELLIERRTRQ
jgi:hypothetical protein